MVCSITLTDYNLLFIDICANSRNRPCPSGYWRLMPLFVDLLLSAQLQSPSPQENLRDVLTSTHLIIVADQRSLWLSYSMAKRCVQKFIGIGRLDFGMSSSFSLSLYLLLVTIYDQIAHIHCIVFDATANQFMSGCYLIED